MLRKESIILRSKLVDSYSLSIDFLSHGCVHGVDFDRAHIYAALEENVTGLAPRCTPGVAHNLRCNIEAIFRKKKNCDIWANFRYPIWNGIQRSVTNNVDSVVSAICSTSGVREDTGPYQSNFIEKKIIRMQIELFEKKKNLRIRHKIVRSIDASSDSFVASKNSLHCRYVVGCDVYGRILPSSRCWLGQNITSNGSWLETASANLSNVKSNSHINAITKN